MNRYEPGDKVEVNICGGIGSEAQWIPVVVTGATHPTYGWTAAMTTSKSDYAVISRGPGWNQDEIGRRES